jgi:flagellar basal-body rod protein FlgF
MLRGLYSAATTMDAADLQHAIVSRNLAHANVPGFRRMFVHQSTEGEEDSGGGGAYHGAGSAEAATDFQYGSEERTGRKLDMRLLGDGFFVVEGPSGPLYTRNGSFQLDAEGRLVTSEGLLVQAEKGGTIQLPANANDTDITVSSSGRIAVRGNNVGTIGRVNFKNLQALQQQGATLYEAPDSEPPQEIETAIQTGARERSNVNPATELVTMLLGMRQYQAAQRTMETIGNAMKERMEVGGGG